MSLTISKNKHLFPEIVNRFWNAEKSILSDFFDFDSSLLKWDGTAEVPAMNVIEHDKSYQIELAAPGKSKDDFKVEVENNVLTISCEKREEKKEDQPNFRRREFSFNYFSRSMTLPENSLPDQISAKYDHGILHLTLPKKEVTVAEKTKQKVKVA